MKPKLPKGIKVGAITYPVEVDESWAEGSAALWTVQVALSVMKFPSRKTVALQRRQVCLLSLCIAAVTDIYGPAGDLDGSLVDALALGLHQVFRGNPQVPAYITRDPKEAAEVPSEVIIGGLTYTIRVDDSFTLADESFAAINYRTLEIRFRLKDVSAEQCQDTLLHEVIHGVNKVYWTGEELSEEWVSALTHGLYQGFRDNPGVLAYVTD